MKYNGMPAGMKALVNDLGCDPAFAKIIANSAKPKSYVNDFR